MEESERDNNGSLITTAILNSYIECPACDFGWYEEGDKSYETLECPKCQEKIYIQHLL